MRQLNCSVAWLGVGAIGTNQRADTEMLKASIG